ncbi:Vitamin B12 import ATP-binding protein BtuD [Balamuthia mandrillaris]
MFPAVRRNASRLLPRNKGLPPLSLSRSLYQGQNPNNNSSPPQNAVGPGDSFAGSAQRPGSGPTPQTPIGGYAPQPGTFPGTSPQQGNVAGGDTMNRAGGKASRGATEEATSAQMQRPSSGPSTTHKQGDAKNVDRKDPEGLQEEIVMAARDDITLQEM